MKRILFFLLIIFIAEILNSCFSTREEYFDSEVISMTKLVIANPEIIPDIFDYYPQFRCDTCKYDFLKDTFHIFRTIKYLKNENFYSYAWYQYGENHVDNEGIQYYSKLLQINGEKLTEKDFFILKAFKAHYGVSFSFRIINGKYKLFGINPAYLVY